MQIDKIRGVQIEEVTPVHIVHKLSQNDPREDWRKTLSLPVTHPRMVHDDFYGPDGKMQRSTSTFSVTA